MYCFEVKILQLKKTRIIFQYYSVDFLYKHSQCLVPTLTMLVKKPRFLIILVCNNSCCLYKTIIVCTLVLVAHNGFAFDFPILLAEVERRPEWTCSISEPGMSTSVTPSLCCGR